MSTIGKLKDLYDKVYNFGPIKTYTNIKEKGIGSGAFTFSVEGDLGDIKKYLINAFKYSPERILRHYGELGVQRLRDATPVDSGNTANSWFYTVSRENGDYVLTFGNHNIQDGVNVAYLIQMGHGTRQGGYVRGNDYINPALKPIYDDIAQGIFKEVGNL